MLEGRFTRFHRETLRTGQQREMGTADLTEQIRQIVKRSMIANGFAHVFVVGATGAVVSIEYEDGLLQDFEEALARLFPRCSAFRESSDS